MSDVLIMQEVDSLTSTPISTTSGGGLWASPTSSIWWKWRRRVDLSQREMSQDMRSISNGIITID